MQNDAKTAKRPKRVYEFAILPFPESLDAFTTRNPHAFAALRVFFALAAIARGQRTYSSLATEEMHEPFYAVYGEIQKVAYINRNEISPALAFLRDYSLIQYTAKPGVRTRYSFCFGEKKRWVQVPLAFFGSDSLKALSLTYTHYAVRERHQYLLGALKLYLYILMTRANRTNRSYVAYSQIEAACKIQKKQIRKTLNILVTEDLIAVETRFKRQDSPELQGYKRDSNAYFIKGLRDFYPLPNLAPADSPSEQESDQIAS